MNNKKILMITGDFTEDYETIVPFQTLLAVGHSVEAVCPDKSSAEIPVNEKISIASLDADSILANEIEKRH